MDKIILKGIQFHGYHGVAEAERQLGQKYEIDLELTDRPLRRRQNR